MGDKFSKILPVDDQDPSAELILGSMDFVVDPSVLTEYNVKSIVSIMESPPEEMWGVLERYEIDKDTDYKVFHLEDSAENYIGFSEGEGLMSVLEFIHVRRQLGKTVLVHCDGGVTRSPSVVIAYIMKYGTDLSSSTGLPYRIAREYVISRHHHVDVSMFDSELQNLDSQLKSQVTLLDDVSDVIIPDEPVPPTVRQSTQPLIIPKLASPMTKQKIGTSVSVLAFNPTSVRRMSASLTYRRQSQAASNQQSFTLGGADRFNRVMSMYSNSRPHMLDDNVVSIEEEYIKLHPSILCFFMVTIVAMLLLGPIVAFRMSSVSFWLVVIVLPLLVVSAIVFKLVSWSSHAISHGICILLLSYSVVCHIILRGWQTSAHSATVLQTVPFVGIIMGHSTGMIVAYIVASWISYTVLIAIDLAFEWCPRHITLLLFWHSFLTCIFQLTSTLYAIHVHKNYQDNYFIQLDKATTIINKIVREMHIDTDEMGIMLGLKRILTAVWLWKPFVPRIVRGSIMSEISDRPASSIPRASIVQEKSAAKIFNAPSSVTLQTVGSGLPSSMYNIPHPVLRLYRKNLVVVTFSFPKFWDSVRAMDPSELSTLCGPHIEALTDLVNKYRGYLYNYSGDHATAVWPLKGQCVLACRAAIEGVNRLISSLQVNPIHPSGPLHPCASVIQATTTLGTFTSPKMKMKVILSPYIEFGKSLSSIATSHGVKVVVDQLVQKSMEQEEGMESMPLEILEHPINSQPTIIHWLSQVGVVGHRPRAPTYLAAFNYFSTGNFIEAQNMLQNSHNILPSSLQKTSTKIMDICKNSQRQGSNPIARKWVSNGWSEEYTALDSKKSSVELMSPTSYPASPGSYVEVSTSPSNQIDNSRIFNISQLELGHSVV